MGREESSGYPAQQVTGNTPSSSKEPSGNGEDTVAQTDTEVPDKNKGPRVRLRRELPAVVCLSLLLAVVVKTFLLQAFYIPSISMTPAYLVDDRILVSKLSSTYEPGDVIVFDSPMFDHVPESLPEKTLRNLKEIVGVQHPTAHLIKRVIAVGGDLVEIREGQVLVNDVALSEPYVAEGSWMGDMAPRRVPPAHLWVMGDNRNSSRDSRWFGPVPVDTVTGKVVFRLWPVKR